MIYVFKKDFKETGRRFYKGQYVEVPDKKHSGQWRILLFWNWVDRLLKNKIIKKTK